MTAGIVCQRAQKSPRKGCQSAQKSLNFGHAENSPHRPQNLRQSRTKARCRQAPPAKGDHVFLVDGSSYIFRAYHALPPLNRKSDGLQVNAVLGFCNMLWKLLRDMPRGQPADASGHHLRQVGSHLPQQALSRLQGAPAAGAGRPDPAICADPRGRARLRPALPGAGRLRGRRSDRDLCRARPASAARRATIVSSDKDLMQLVTDCVTMYDTMKDRRIGIPEVIEKFGVPPEKVVEVQALAGDSTDNVPGVPGIGVKTAAQLIVEYGDLEHAAVPRRRDQAAEAARGADRECREGADLAPAGAARRQGRARRAARRTRGARARRAQADRVPEGDGIFHADPPRRRLFADRSGRYRAGSRQQERRQRVCAAAAVGRRTCPAPARIRRRRARCLRADSSGHASGRAADKQDKASSPKGTPISLAAARAEAARKIRSIATSIRPIRSLDQLKAWSSRASTMPAISRSRRRPTRSIRCRRRSRGIALALAPNDACYIPLGHKQSGDGAGLFDAGLAPDQIKAGDALDALRPLLESPGHSQDRLQHQVQRRDVRAAWHHHSQPSTTRS